MNMRRYYLLFSFLLVYSYLPGQNLVPNPSFEDTISCPTGPGQIQQAIGWSAFGGSPDYFNSCSPMSSYYGVPANAVGYQQAASGNAYVGIICFVNNVFGREIIADSLIAPLSIGQKYFVSFKVSQADNASVVGYSINKIGAKFSTVTHTNVNIDNSAHIYSNSVISDTVNWTRISDSFVADSAFNYIMIGNFFDDANTIIVNNGTGFGAYYLIDDVCVSTDSILCANFSTSVEENNIIRPFSFYPNPATDFLTIKNNFNTPFNLTVFHSLGPQLYFKQNITSKNFQLELIGYNAGLLFIKIDSQNKQYIYKLLKQ